MLILTRRVGEMVKIGGNVEVTVMAVNGCQVRLGVAAPKEVSVDREEIAERKRAEGHDPNLGDACPCRRCVAAREKRRGAWRT